MKTIKLLIFLTCITSTTMLAQQDQGVTSDVHRQYLGKIVFTSDKDAIAFKNERPSAFKTEFDASEPIYSRLYLNESLTNATHSGGKAYNVMLMYDMYIDGIRVNHKKSFGMYKHVPEDDLTYYTEQDIEMDKQSVWTSWRPSILPLESDPELKYGTVNIQARAFALALLDQSVGTHEVTLKLYSMDMTNAESVSEVLAEGAFSIDVTSAFKQELAFKYAPPLPKDEWQGADKEGVKEQIAKAFEQELRKKPIIVGIYGIDWKEGSYSLTGQKYKKVAGWAVFEDGDGDGQVPITTFNFISDYTNGGWTKLRFDSHCLGCPDWDVEVAAVKALGDN